MSCARRSSVYAFLLGICVVSQSISAFAKDGKESSGYTVTNVSSSTPSTTFQWSQHKKLSWDDFRGPVEHIDAEAAAATHCSIGLKIHDVGGKPEVTVYNAFYTDRSWVQADAHLPGILVHEQGHFDLCELYTRKLRDRVAHMDSATPDYRQQLQRAYQEVKADYEASQRAYESETIHGTNIAAQKKWSTTIAGNLSL